MVRCLECIHYDLNGNHGMTLNSADPPKGYWNYGQSR